MLGSNVEIIVTILLPFGSSCAYLSTADESNVRIQSELRRSGFTTAIIPL